MKTRNIIIAGRNVVLQQMERQHLKGITIGDSLSYHFFTGQYGDIEMVFLEPRRETAPPRALDATRNSVGQALDKSVVFLLEECPAYLRQRLIDKGIYFVVSDKFAFMPTLLINERTRKLKKAKRLTPAAQYLLLYHLQVDSLEGKTAKDLADRMPYSYATVALAITCLADLELCEKVSDGRKSNVLHFTQKGKSIWEKAQSYFINPVEQRVYCDELLSEAHYATCGINALSHYTRLNPDPERMIAVSGRQMNELKAAHALVRENEYDGEVLIEVWKYPPVSPDGWQAQYVDRLSLVLTLCDDEDPRVEGEMEYLMDNVEWKD